MKIEKGIVKYKDRSDIICTYGTTDDGTKYYFLDENDEKKFANGNRIVSTLLVEAIDPMVKAANVGVIDNNGVVIIPCVNRSIRVVDDKTILIEAAVPISQSVIDAVNLRNDPLSAAKLVSTPAAIKDKINALIGNDGKYLFNDQFSEATVCDIDGNNLVDSEYYSFIASANGKLYMSKNVVDTEVKEYVIGGESLDVTSVSVDQSVVESSLTGQDSSSVENNNDTVESTDNSVANEGATSEVPPLDSILPSSDVVDSGFASDVVAPPLGGIETSNDSVSSDVDDSISNVSDETEVSNDSLVGIVPDFSTSSDLENNNTSDSQVDEESFSVPSNGGFDVGNISSSEMENTGLNDISDTSSSFEESSGRDEGFSSSDGFIPPILPTVDEENQDDMPEAVDDGVEDVEIPEVAEDSELEETSTVDTAASTFEIPSLPTDDSGSNEVEDSSSDLEVPALPLADEEKDTSSLDVEDSEEENVLNIFNDNLTNSNDDKENDVNIFDKHETTSNVVTIDPETVASTVDKDGNGVLDSEDDISEASNASNVTGLDDYKLSPNSSIGSLDNGSNTGHDYDKAPNLDIGTNDSMSRNIGVMDSMNVSNSYMNGVSDISSSSSYSKTSNHLMNFDRGLDSYSSNVSSMDYPTLPRDNKFDSLFTNVKPDRITYGEGRDNIMSDVVRSMSELMRQNREQRGVLVQYQDRLDSSESQRRLLAEQYKQQTARVESLASKLRSLEESTTRLESRAQMYESRIRDQEKIIAAQERELRTLRPQLEGKQDLVKLLADAKVLLGNDNDYSSYDDGNNFYRRAA